MLYSNPGLNGKQQRLPDGQQVPPLTTSNPCEAGQTLSQPPVARLTSIQQNLPSNVDATRISEADLLLNLHSYPTPMPRMPSHPTASGTVLNTEFIQNSSLSNQFGQFQGSAVMPYSGMMIESQDIDMSMIADDMMWFEYLPQDFKREFGGPNLRS